eukprot:6570808-Pyramimonas_sp.AAC.1
MSFRPDQLNTTRSPIHLGPDQTPQIEHRGSMADIGSGPHERPHQGEVARTRHSVACGINEQ